MDMRSASLRGDLRERRVRGADDVKSFVTGAAGFLGAHLCRRLARDGHDVIALDCRARPLPLAVDGIQYLQADLRAADSWRHALDGAATVFHLASVPLEGTR